MRQHKIAAKIAFSPIYSIQIIISNAFAFQIREHLHQSKLMISGLYSSFSSPMTIFAHYVYTVV